MKRKIIRKPRKARSPAKSAEVKMMDDARLSVIFDANPTGMMLVERNSRIIAMVNQAAAKMVGLPKERITGNICHGFICPAEQTKCPILDLKQDVDRSERILIRGDNSRMPILKTVVPVKLDGKDYLMESFIDITERKLAEETTKKSNIQYRTMVDYSNDLIWMLDAQGNFTFLNRRAEEVSGYKLVDLTGKSFAPLIVAEELPRIMQVFKDVMNGKTLHYEVSVCREDGSVFVLSANTTPIREHGKVIGSVSFGQDITERKEAEKALSRSEELYRFLFNNMLNGFAYCKMVFEQDKPQDFIYLGVNSAFESLTGLKDVVGKRVTEVVPGIRGTSPELFEIYGRVALTGKPERFETYLESLKMWFSISVYSPEKEYFVAIFDVITARKQAEETLRNSEKALAEAQAIARLGSWEYDVSSQKRTWSREMFNIFGRDKQMGEPSWPEFEKMVHPDDWPSLYNAMQSAIKDGTPYSLEFRIIRPDGKTTWVVTIGKAVQDANGKVVKLQGTVQDITERKKAEFTLKESVSKFRGLFEASAVGMIMTDLNAQFVLVNPAACNILGYTEDELVTKTFLDITHLDNTISPMDDITNLLAGRIDWYHAERRYIRKNSDLIWVHLTMSLVRDADNNPMYFIGQFYDITKRKHAEEENAKLQTQLLQVQKLESIGTLSAGIAHDFNNIMTAIQGNTDLVRMELDKSHPATEYLNRTAESVKRAAELTQKLLLFSRKQHINPVPMKVNSAVESVFNMLKRTLGEDIAVSLELAPDIWTVKADVSNMEQVIMNLVINSRDAMPKGGTITAKSENITIDSEMQKFIPESRAGRFACLAVADTGTGIAPEIMPRIFEPFFTTKDVSKGSGLGLSVVYGIIQRHDGWINVYSQPAGSPALMRGQPGKPARPDDLGRSGGGSTFKIYLPAVDEPVQAKKRRHRNNRRRGPQGQRRAHPGD